MDYREYLDSIEADARIDELQESLSALNDGKLQALEGEDEGIITRAQEVLQYAALIYTSANPNLIPKPLVSGLADALDGVAHALDAIAAAPAVQEQQATLLTDAIDRLASQAVKWPYANSGENWRDAVTQAASIYRRSAGQVLGRARAEADEVLQEVSRAGQKAISQLEDLAAKAQTEMRLLRDETSALHTQVESMRQQQELLNSQIERAAARNDQVVSDARDQLSALREKNSADMQAAILELSKRSDRLVDTLSNQADESLAKLHDKVAEAGNLVSVFAAAGTANAYSTEAKEQAKKADAWRGWAILLALAAALSTLLVFFADSDVATLTARLTLTVAIGGLAAYAARQSSRHRNREERARHLELNIATTGPLLLDADPDTIVQARLKVMEVMLAAEGQFENSRSITDEHINLLGRMVDILARSPVTRR